MVNINKSIQSVERALTILEIIAAAGGELRLVDLSEQTGLHKSTLHGLLNSLAAMGYITRRGTHYRLGLRLREIAQPLNDVDTLLREAFSPALHALSALSRETCYLAVPCGTREYLCINALESNRGLRAAAPRGCRQGLTTSAIGKVFLAFDDDLARSLRRAGLLAASLQEELAGIVADGYALDLEQAEHGLNCVALPLRRKGQVVAALGVAAPAARLPETALRVLAARAMRELFDMLKL